MHPWAALVTVAGTPNALLERLQRDVLAALDAPDVRQRAEQAGFEITPSTPQALRERISADLALYGRWSPKGASRGCSRPRARR